MRLCKLHQVVKLLPRVSLSRLLVGAPTQRAIAEDPPWSWPHLERFDILVRKTPSEVRLLAVAQSYLSRTTGFLTTAFTVPQHPIRSVVYVTEELFLYDLAKKPLLRYVIAVVEIA